MPPAPTQTRDPAADALLAKGDALGTAASKTTGVAYNPILKPATEPAVISSTQIDDHIADTKTKLATFSNKGTTVGADGNAYYADKSMVPAPQDATYNDTTGQYEYEGSKYGVKDFYQDDPDGDWAAVQGLFAPLKANLDANTLAQVSGIHSQFDALRAEQAQYNKQAEQVRAQALLLGGASRYAPLAASSTMTAQVSYGLKKIQDLDNQENEAIAKANQAQQDGDMKLMSDAFTMAEGVRKEKQTEATKIADQLRTANQKLREQNLQSSRDSAIADLVSQGISDPAQVLNYLNYHEDGTKVGDFTADEVSKVLKALTVDGDQASLPADLKAFDYLRDHGMLPDNIANLDPKEQYFGYLTALKGASNTGDFTLGTNQIRYDAQGHVVARGPAGKQTVDDTAPSWEAYKAAATKLMGSNYLMATDEDALRQQYNNDYPGGKKPSKFTDSELRKLEQGGLTDAPRKEQLDYLYKPKDDATPDFLQ